MKKYLPRRSVNKVYVPIFVQVLLHEGERDVDNSPHLVIFRWLRGFGESKCWRFKVWVAWVSHLASQLLMLIAD